MLWPKTCTVSPPRKPRKHSHGGTRTHSGKGVIHTDDTRVSASKVTTRPLDARDPDAEAEADDPAAPANGVFHHVTEGASDITDTDTALAPNTPHAAPPRTAPPSPGARTSSRAASGRNVTCSRTLPGKMAASAETR